MVLIGKTHDKKFFLEVNEKNHKKNNPCLAGLKLNKAYFNKKPKGPYCTIFKNDIKVEINDYKLCRNSFLNLFK